MRRCLALLLLVAGCSNVDAPRDRAPSGASYNAEHPIGAGPSLTDPDPAVATIGQWNLPQGDTIRMHFQLLPKLTDGSVTGVALSALQAQVAAVRAAAAASPGVPLSLTLSGTVLKHASGRITQQLTQNIVAQ